MTPLLDKAKAFATAAHEGQLRKYTGDPYIVHPIRVAERAAALDILSGGRLELGTARSSTWTELGGFNVDPDFGDVLDGLMLVDLAQVQRAILVRYMGRENATRFLAYHA